MLGSSTSRARTVAAIGMAAAALTLSACSSGGSADASGESNAAGTGPSIVASTTIWGDITSQIVACAGEGQVTTLMPVGADPHDYSPASNDIAQMVNADLVVVNGLNLEEGLESAIDSAQSDGANVFAVAPELDPIPFAGEAHSDEETATTGEAATPAAETPAAESPAGEAAEGAAAEEEDHSGDDPHVWLDMTRAATGATLIGEQLATATGNTKFAECGTQVADDITATNTEVAALLESVPADQRVLITDHDAFGYFSKAYGYEVVGVVIPGGSTLGEPSSTELAALAATIQAEGVPAIFANTATSTKLTDALASEAGNVEVVPLYVGSVGEPGTPAATYQGMMRVNAERISTALKG